MARRQPRHQSQDPVRSYLQLEHAAASPQVLMPTDINNSSGDRRASMRASSSRRSQIQALRARLLQQDARIAELKAQALHAKGTINSLKDSVETKKPWYKDNLALAKKYYEDDLARMKRYYDSDLATAERWHKSDLASARTFYNDSLQQDRQRALVDSERHYRTLNAFTNFVGQPPAEASTVEVPAPALDRILDTPLVITHPLTSVRLVGESHLCGCVDVLTRISSFLLRT